MSRTHCCSISRLGLGRGNHQGQRLRLPREQAGHTSASDQCKITQKSLAMQELSTQAIHAPRSILDGRMGGSGREAVAHVAQAGLCSAFGMRL